MTCGLLLLLEHPGGNEIEATRIYCRARRGVLAFLIACSRINSAPANRTPLGFPQADPLMPANLAALKEGLKAAGLEEGRNIRIEDRWPGIDRRDGTERWRGS